MDFITNHRSH